MAWRPPFSRNCCELCCCSSRHVQFGAGNSIEITTSTHNLDNLSKGSSWHKWWCYSIRFGCRPSGITHNCHYIDGIDPILSPQISRNRSSRTKWLELDAEKSLHICDDIM